jgi:homoserine kinase
MAADDRRPVEPGTEFAVPASISNLGPGFDAVSVAVQLYLRVRVLEVRPSSPGALDFRFVTGPVPGDNRIEAAFRRARAAIGAAAPGLSIEVESDVPARSGLGSSAAATVAGLRLYEAVTGPQPDETWLAIAAAMEGHADNAAAALLGGVTISCLHDDGGVTARTSPWPAEIGILVATPDVPLETERARGVLPASVPLRDAVFNLQRALLLVRALEQRQFGDLREAMRDRWHQRQRAPLVPGLRDALAFDHPSLLGVCLSGAGPSIAAFTTGDDSEVMGLFASLYDRLGVKAAIRRLGAHQPNRCS